MAIEIEMKLAVKDDVTGEAVESVLSDLLGGETWQETPLRNVYFDTSDLVLNKARIALRIRHKGGRYIQTLKTKGESINGLHRRGEWEWDLIEDALDLKLLKACDTWPHSVDVKTLKPIFETNFVRLVSKLHWQKSEIELAYDLGSVIVGSSKASIREIELEFLSGQESDLLSLAQCLQQKLELKADDVSKAERGYRLFLKGIDKQS